MRNAFVILIAFTCGCHDWRGAEDSRSILAVPDVAKAPEYRVIARVDANDKKTHEMISSLLKEEGIDCYIEGSIAYGVFVAESDKTHALRILKGSELLKNRNVYFD
jgi:hypothetical protein